MRTVHKKRAAVYNVQTAARCKEYKQFVLRGAGCSIQAYCLRVKPVRLLGAVRPSQVAAVVAIGGGNHIVAGGNALNSRSVWMVSMNCFHAFWMGFAFCPPRRPWSYRRAGQTPTTPRDVIGGHAHKGIILVVGGGAGLGRRLHIARGLDGGAGRAVPPSTFCSNLFMIMAVLDWIPWVWVMLMSLSISTSPVVAYSTRVYRCGVTYSPLPNIW